MSKRVKIYAMELFRSHSVMAFLMLGQRTPESVAQACKNCAELFLEYADSQGYSESVTKLAMELYREGVGRRIMSFLAETPVDGPIFAGALKSAAAAINVFDPSAKTQETVEADDPEPAAGEGGEGGSEPEGGSEGGTSDPVSVDRLAELKIPAGVIDELHKAGLDTCEAVIKRDAEESIEKIPHIGEAIRKRVLDACTTLIEGAE